MIKYLSPDKYLLPALHDFSLCLYEKSTGIFHLVSFFAIFSVVILAQVITLLVFVGATNWRYYYFVLMGGYFLLPVALLDWQDLISQKQTVDD